MPDPLWLKFARLEKGVTETPGAGSTPRIDEYLRTVGLSDDATPWCSSFVNWCFLQCGIIGTGSAAARSWLEWGDPVDEPRIGAVVVLRRGAQSWQGHVGFVTGTHGQFVQVIGGNQGDKVSEQIYPKARVLSYRWPRGVQRHDAAH